MILLKGVPIYPYHLFCVVLCPSTSPNWFQNVCVCRYMQGESGFRFDACVEDGKYGSAWFSQNLWMEETCGCHNCTGLLKTQAHIHNKGSCMHSISSSCKAGSFSTASCIKPPLQATQWSTCGDSSISPILYFHHWGKEQGYERSPPTRYPPDKGDVTGWSFHQGSALALPKWKYSIGDKNGLAKVVCF